jgi:amino acid adenylation domain-containing protein
MIHEDLKASDLSQRIEDLSPGQLDRLLRALQDRKQPAGDRIRPRPRDGAPLPLSFAQERLWFLDQLQPGSAAYNVPAAFRLRGPLSVGLLARALTAIVRRHETLRTTFASVEGSPVQQVGAAAAVASVALPVIDLATLAAGRRQAEAARLAGEEARRPFALERGPLLRATLLRAGGTEHVLVLNLHHIISDAWSLGVLIGETAALYSAFAAGEEPRRAELPIQYADFALWQCAALTGDRLERQLAYWRQRLAGLSILELPADRPRPAAATWRGAQRTFRLPASLAAQLRGLGEEEGATLFTVLLTAFAVLLHRWAAQEDIAIGTVLANRQRSEVAELIGLFANTLVLRATVGGGDCRALLRQLHDASLDAQAHQDLPFEKLVEDLNPARTLSQNPLVQVMFSLQNAPFAAALPGTGLSVERVETHSGTAKLDLFLLLWEEGGGLAGSVEYSTDLFDADTIGRLLRRYETLLAALAADSGRRPDELPLLPQSERHQLLAEWNDTALDLSPEAGGRLAAHHLFAHQLFSKQARRTPAAPAIVCGDRRLTYEELDRRANQLAHHLRALVPGREGRIGVCLPRSEEVVVALLAVLKTGSAYVPLDPDHPRERLAFVVANARLGALLTDARRAALFAGLGVPVVRIDEERDAIAARGTDEPPAPDLPAPLAYFMYTSGSTGTPKGVMVGHANVSNLFAAMDRWLGTRPGRWLAVTSISFDISVVELLWPITRGYTVFVYSAAAGGAAGAAGDQGSIPDQVLRHSISHLQCTPSTVMGFILDPLAPAALARLERLQLGGEDLPAALAGRLLESMRGQLSNLYAPTETTVWSTSERIAPGAPITFGRPLANTELHVLDPHLRLVPAGQPGELYVGGAGVARGYWERPELTAERFLPDPFTSRPGGRLYRTGDLVRRRPDGRVTFLGRLDFQVKLRGHRIELGEIESVLAGHPALREAVVMARRDAPGDLRLVAYLVLEEAPATDASGVRAELEEHARRKLPHYMCPEAYVVLPALPLTATGKVDRKALPPPERELAAAGHVHVAPRTEAQATLVATWHELLPAGRIGIHDNFFELGGNSLKVMQLRSRIRSAFGVDVALRTLFEAQTVARQVESVERALRTDGGGARPPLRPVHDGGDPPLSFSQERLWFLDQLEPGSAVYNLPVAVRLDGELAPAALAAAIERVAERHASLRTTIGTPAGRPVQVIAPRADLPLPLVDLAALAAGAREATAERLAAAEALSPFDLARGPLVRARLLRLDARRHVLLVTCHHIVTDGWSLRVFFAELAALYVAALAAGEPAQPPQPALPALPVQYADFAHWQRRWLQGEELARLLAYWRERLAGAPAALELPLDHPRPAVQTYRGASRPLRLGPEVTAPLRAFCRGENATLFMTLLAACATVFHRHTGQRDLVLGTPTANRDPVEVEGLIGFFANSLALRLDLAGDPPFRDLLARVRTAVLADYAHQEIPFEKLVQELRPERDLSHNPIYQAVFALESAERAPGGEIPGLRLTPLPAAGGTAKFDFALYMEDQGEGLSGLLETNRDLFDPATGARWLAQLETLVAALLAQPQRRLSELALLGAAERHQLLFEANDTAREAPAEPFVHRLFAARAAAHPGAPAVSQEDRRLTYGQLDRQAGRLARRLRSLGVGPEVRVAVSVERSPELIVALLAVWKAGGAYVPLDPAYPQERLAFLLADSRASVLLTQEALAGRFSGVPTLLVDGGEEEPAAGPADDLAVSLRPDNLAYVIYTSGSTGRPKGVMIEHRALASYTATVSRAYAIEPADRVLQFCSISFDISLEEIVPCLAGGGELVLRTEAMIESIATFLAVCRQRGISLLSLPTAYWHEITARVEAEGLELPPSLRLIIIAGERALPERLAAWRRHAPVRPRLVNTYGLTESTIISTLADLTAAGADAGAAREVPIGFTIADSEVHLLDGALAPVPLGVAGEIHLGGGLLARGYLHRPDVSAERFIPHPFASVPGARLYRTGDLGRRLPGGNLEFLGRGDQQVKVRGYRIELGEIETVLAEHPAAAAAVVTVREDRPGQKQLVAYLATGPERPAGLLEDLRAFLRRRLPDYMQPGTFVFLAAMPLTPNGKVDRAALPAPQGERPDLRAEYVPPGDETEIAVAAVWQEVLGLERVGLHDNFFDLGGHSLLLIQIHDRLRERFGRDLPIVELFKHPTVGSLARHLSEEPAAVVLAGDAVRDRAAKSRAAVREGRFLKARRKAP